ncbi:MAG: hypothetical protein SFU25_06480 [Candidatus Caenarcaniphilales bacterium]|nr:hypothetical protein [Candidatus Caenarcaniphilales bacterium]
MSQLTTLQDIYAQLNNIQSILCQGIGTGSAPTRLLTEVVLDEQLYNISTLEFENPDDNQDITDLQGEINKIVNASFKLAKDERLATDSQVANGQGVLIPTPKGTPIALIPKLLNTLRNFELPSTLLGELILSFLKEILIEHIKRKLDEKTGKYSDSQNVQVAKLIAIPSTAKAIAIRATGLPAFLSKRFAPQNEDLSAANNAPVSTEKFILDALGSCQIGSSFVGDEPDKAIFWGQEIKIEFDRQLIFLEKPEFVNARRWAYLRSTQENTLSFKFIQDV